MSKKNVILVILMVSIAQIALAAIEARTYKKDGIYFIEGRVEASQWYERGLSAITDYTNYREWITKGIDGKDPVSAEFWEHFTDFEYEAPNKMVVLYDLNLSWPLGSKGNRARFRVDESQLYKGNLRFRMVEKPAGLEEMTLSLYSEDSTVTPGGKTFRFEMAIGFSWLLDALIDPEKLSKHMNIVVETVIGNLETYCQVKPN